MATETELVRSAKAGSERAFEQLVLDNERRVFHIALRFLGNEQDAQDACQEVFLRAYRFLPKFQEESRFSTWLYRITMNVCKDSVRKTRMLAELPLVWPEDEEGEEQERVIADLRYDPESSLDRAELRETLRQGLLRLSPNHREVVILRDIAGMSYSEIARGLSLEVGTVKSRLARARESLRVFLMENGNFSPSVQSKNVKGGDLDA